MLKNDFKIIGFIETELKSKHVNNAKPVDLFINQNIRG